jgi:hypothetical protein
MTRLPVSSSEVAVTSKPAVVPEGRGLNPEAAIERRI